MNREEAAVFADLAGLLATGYLRLIERSRNGAVSGPGFEQKELEIPPRQSPHVSTPETPKWTRACSTESTRFGE